MLVPMHPENINLNAALKKKKIENNARVKWKFLFATLQRCGFGESFMNWTRAQYPTRAATVITDGLISSQFILHNGTRQGCPLSPTQF